MHPQSKVYASSAGDSQLVALDKLTGALEVISRVPGRTGDVGKSGRWEVDAQTGAFVLIPPLSPWIVSVNILGIAYVGRAAYFVVS